MTIEKLKAQYEKNKRDIARLRRKSYNGHGITIAEVDRLARHNEIAYQNDLKRLETGREL